MAFWKVSFWRIVWHICIVRAQSPSSLTLTTLDTSQSLEASVSYRRYGRFLATLSSVSLLSITSCHKHEESVNSAVFKEGHRIALNTSTYDDDLGNKGHGTKVVVRNLFQTIPVRLKHCLARFQNKSEVDKEFSTLRRTLAGIILATERPINFDIRENSNEYTHKSHANDAKRPDEINLRTVVSTLHQAGLVDSPILSSWRLAMLKSPKLSLQAAISLEAAPSKAVQFISLRQHPLPHRLCRTFTNEINALFDSSNFGTERDVNEQGDKQRFTKGSLTEQGISRRKSINRWPMFYVRIDFETSVPLVEVLQADADKVVASVSGLLHALFTEFLETNGFKKKKNMVETKPYQHKDNTTGFSNLDTWSRIKSGKGSPTDILSGLPFMNAAHLSDRLGFITSGQIQPTDDSSETALRWISPRTGNALLINSRTGMAMPSKEVKGLGSTMAKRKLNAVVEAVNDYVPSTATEQPLKSIVIDPGNFKHGQSSTGNPCTFGIGGKSIYIDSSTSRLSITKDNLRSVRVIGQVDKKFILASIPSDDKCNMLILIDQHAADERIRVEELFQRLIVNKPVPLAKPVIFHVNMQEMQRFKVLQAYFATWEIHYILLTNQIQVSALPELIVERCRTEPKVLVNLLRTEVWRDVPRSNTGTHWTSRIASCPQGMLELLASRACRSAVMFNDELPSQQCREIVQRLCDCSFPFQCAHGRPSLTTIGQYRTLDEENRSSFGNGWKGWVD